MRRGASLIKKKFIAQTTREIIAVAHELLDCENMDDFWKHAVEQARQRLGENGAASLSLITRMASHVERMGPI